MELWSLGDNMKIIIILVILLLVSSVNAAYFSSVNSMYSGSSLHNNNDDNRIYYCDDKVICNFCFQPFFCLCKRKVDSDKCPIDEGLNRNYTGKGALIIRKR